MRQNMHNKLTIRQKTWMLITSVVSVSVIGVLLLTHYLYENFYIDKQIELLTARGDLLTDLYFDDNSAGKEDFLDRVEWMNKCAEANVFFTENVSSLLVSGENERLFTIDESKQLQNGETINIVRRQLFSEKPIMGVAVPILDEDGCLLGVVFLYNTLLEVFEPFYSSQIWIGVGLIFLIIFIVYSVRRIMNKITQPLENMRIISEKMASGDFSQRIEVQSNDEIGSLSKSFNTLSATLEQEELKKQEFLSNVSHELRTPLSYIKGYTEAILDEVVDDPKRYIETINKESDRMHRLVNDLLDLAQLEGDSYPMRSQPLPFAQLIQDVVERFELASQKKKVIITKDLDHDAIIFGDADRLEQVIGNLLDNALRYTPKGKKIELTLICKENYCEFIISDQGPGIPEESLPKITERFYRVDKGRSRKEGGTGLGLSIVSEILKKHHAKLTFESKENQGTTVKIVFPTNM
ncbi:ATP-binding protein [Bacillaceae bacterium IKA-2]|nr:ATP-binding protein [Bacillaceae bacterium IKA-2]